ncbi:hypothetical protein CYLTODRAFT_421566 [Cylindrobasidium torrendii FP15055 ss-10]|uniref:Uncharacterized protein n=1 Tax=Cylindrobasidium torrendii FP15055 ss-10 TaxID=1314674 RepID=A0A0D7BE27_9AGAR|nr:hypothetical protein CYLTODRAFT_421566 [Cylindrobasidium torrendii FP15055 ss-10]
MALKGKARASTIEGDHPRDLVCLFHASFHPTHGNTIDFSLGLPETALAGLEFACLPSGSHLIDDDVVYVSVDAPSGSDSKNITNSGPAYHGVALFTRRSTAEAGQRGARLESIGVLVAAGGAPWRHLEGLRTLIGASNEHRTAFWEARQQRAATIQPPLIEGVHEGSPLEHLPHVARLLGPTLLTLGKYAAGRRRVLVYTQPPVEGACIFAWVVGALGPSLPVLGLVTLSDFDRLASCAANGWVACTTDKIFLEKTNCYDLLVDLTGGRPVFWAGKEQVTYAWSDLAAWRDVSRILDSCGHSHSHIAAGTVGWGQWGWWDVCAMCASMFKSVGSYAVGEGAVRMETTPKRFAVQPLGNGIEGRPSTEPLMGADRYPDGGAQAVLDIMSQQAHGHRTLMKMYLGKPRMGGSVTLSARDIAAFGLGPWSVIDARYLEWLAGDEVRLIVKRSWKDVFGVVFGY